MKRSSLLAGVSVFVVLGAVAGGLTLYKVRALNAPPPPAWEPSEAVQIVTAREVRWTPTADLVGTVFALRSVRVQTEVAGRIRAVSFESGAVVEPGQVLVVLDDVAERADLRAAEANVRVAAASVTAGAARVRLAEAELRRLSAMTGVATETELDRARAELDRARADQERLAAEVDASAARVAQVQARLDKLTVRAPFRARAGLRLVHEGQYLGEGALVVALEEVADTIYLDFAIPQEYAPRVRRGTTVLGTSAVLGPDPVRIEVVALDASVNPDTRNIRVRAVIEDKAGLLRPGMFVPIRVPTDDPRPFVVVPTTAVRRSSYASEVFAVVAGAAAGELRAKQRFVKLGPTIGDDVVVLEGVAAGEEVAATGAFKLRDGVLVRRAEVPGAATASPVTSSQGK